MKLTKVHANPDDVEETEDFPHCSATIEADGSLRVVDAHGDQVKRFEPNQFLGYSTAEVEDPAP